MHIPPFPSVGFRCPVSEIDLLERLWRWTESYNKTQDLARKLELLAFKTELGLSPDRHHHMPRASGGGRSGKGPWKVCPGWLPRAKAVLTSRAAGGGVSPPGGRGGHHGWQNWIFPTGRGVAALPHSQTMTCGHRS